MSDELANKLARASQHIDAGFGARHVELGLAALEQRIAGRRRLKHAALALSAAAALVLVSIPWSARERVQLAAAPPMADPLRTLTTRDGSVASPLDEQTLLAVTRDAADEVTLDLKRGSGHFEVTPNPKRRYRVRAGEVEVDVLGTAFDVERRAGSARVHVNHGVVRVGWPSGAATLHAGESGIFPPPATAPAPVTDATPTQSVQVATPEPAAQQARRVPRERGQAWRDLARAGKHQEAFGSLGKEPVEDLAGLLLAADAARLSGHPHEAARYLEHLVQRYPQSPSAPLAAFTLGRLALYELKQPALAAGSFARAYTLDPKGPMAEDALANEAEAYHRAGDAQRTRSAVERYLARYPGGARRKELAGYAAP